MNIFVILICLFVALAVLIPLLEKYQGTANLCINELINKKHKKAFAG